MVNTKYSYPWIGLWEGKGYPDSGRGVLGLVEPLCDELTATDYIPAKPEDERRKDGRFEPHPGTYAAGRAFFFVTSRYFLALP